MGRVIITYRNFNQETVESLKCKSYDRAQEIVSGRNNVKLWKYYETGAIIPRSKKKIKQPEKMGLEEMERRISQL